MRITAILILIILFINLGLNGQTRTINGRVISENLEPLPLLEIKNSDTVLLGKTDMDGRFQISFPLKTDRLLFAYLGMEWTEIKLRKDCDTIEIVMMFDAIYDFISSNKIDRLRKKRFDELPYLHSNAFKKGLFIKNTICYTREFKPYKPELDEIGKRMKETKIQIKKTFKELAIGDTIIIPFSVSWRHDGTDRTTLSIWSSYTDEKKFDCLIQGIILDKNKRKNGYNIIYKVINCDRCKYDSTIYEKRDMINGAVFEQNMKYFKVLKK